MRDTPSSGRPQREEEKGASGRPRHLPEGYPPLVANLVWLASVSGSCPRGELVYWATYWYPELSAWLDTHDVVGHPGRERACDDLAAALESVADWRLLSGDARKGPIPTLHRRLRGLVPRGDTRA